MSKPTLLLSIPDVLCHSSFRCASPDLAIGYAGSSASWASGGVSGTRKRMHVPRSAASMTGSSISPLRSQSAGPHRCGSARGVQNVSPVSAHSIAAGRSSAAAYFNTKAEAPARNATRATFSSPPAVTSTTLICGNECLMVRQASSPFIPGMARSATMTSGWSAAAASRSARPSRTAPTTS